MNLRRREFLAKTGLVSGSLAMGSCVTIPGLAKRKTNVLLILADDMGYSDAECYGGDVYTPNLNTLAEGGVRFTQHYSTGRCWPSRACILSGFYAQQIRRDSMEGIKMGNRPSWAPLVPELLKPHGYHSYHSGKWHIDGTPLEAGFERSWGGNKEGCDWDRYFDSKPWTEGSYSGPAADVKNYYSTVAIADHTLACLKIHKEEHPDKPFFQYTAFYSPHFPLQAMQGDINRYRNNYIEGWDSIRKKRWERMKEMGLINCDLSERQTDTIPGWNLKPDELNEIYGPGEVPRAVAWDTLTDEQKRYQATKMAIHAAMITRMDMEIGRIVQQLKDMGEYENTLILFASDNGASAEQINRGDKHDKNSLPGSPRSYMCLGPGWATAANTPFRLHKHWNHEGGISSPLIAHWPAKITAKGELRHDPGHFIDIVPTILDVAGIKCPPRPGVSLVPAFRKDGKVKHDYLWWCHQGNRAIRMGDWKLSAKGNGEWELYDLSKDRCEMNDLASKHPATLAQLSDRWKAVAAEFREKLQNTEG